MQNKPRNKQLWLFLLPALGIAALSAMLVWYNISHAPAIYPVELLVVSSQAALNPYPELEGTQIFINTATAAELEQLPEIGPTRAANIVKYIEEEGPLTSLDELMEIKGIGPAILEKIKPYLILDS